LDAALRTAQQNWGKPQEEYALGALEATANVVYVLVIGSNMQTLEAKCQQLASYSIERHQTLKDAGFDESVLPHKREMY